MYIINNIKECEIKAVGNVSGMTKMQTTLLYSTVGTELGQCFSNLQQ